MVWSHIPSSQPNHWPNIIRREPSSWGGLSKHLSLGGWRLGKALLPLEQSELMTAVCVIASETWSCATAPVQYAAVTAYSGDPDIETYIQECAAIHRARTQHIWGCLVELGIRCPQPQGGFYLLPNFDRWQEPLAQRGVTTSLQLADYLLQKYQIATLPGSAYGIPASELSLRVATSFVDMETEAAAKKVLAAWRACNGNVDSFIDNHHPNTASAMARIKQFLDDLH